MFGPMARTLLSTRHLSRPSRLHYLLAELGESLKEAPLERCLFFPASLSLLLSFAYFFSLNWWILPKGLMGAAVRPFSILALSSRLG